MCTHIKSYTYTKNAIAHAALIQPIPHQALFGDETTQCNAILQMEKGQNKKSKQKKQKTKNKKHHAQQENKIINKKTNYFIRGTAAKFLLRLSSPFKWCFVVTIISQQLFFVFIHSFIYFFIYYFF